MGERLVPLTAAASAMGQSTVLLTLAGLALLTPYGIGNAQYVSPVIFPPPPTYQLREPALTLVATDSGLVAAKFYPYPPLRVVDPTDDIACKLIPRGGLTLLYIPVTYLPSFRKHEIYKMLVDEKAHLEKQGDNSLIIYLKSMDVPVPPKGFRRIYIQQDEPNQSYRVPAYAPEVPLTDVDEVPPEGFAPPPVFATLCVSPEKPKPTPVLYYPVAPEWASLLGPTIDIQDLTPEQVTSKEPKISLPHRNFQLGPF